MNLRAFTTIPQTADWPNALLTQYEYLDDNEGPITSEIKSPVTLEPYSILSFHNSDMTLARADGAHQPAVAMALNGAAPEAIMILQWEGPITNEDWTLIPGQLYWLSPTVYGGFTDTKPAENAQLIGFGYDVHTLYLTGNILIESQLTRTTTTTTTTCSTTSSFSTTSTGFGYTTQSTSSSTTTTSPYLFEDGFEDNDFLEWDLSDRTYINSFREGRIGLYCAEQEGDILPYETYNLCKYIASPLAEITVMFNFEPHELSTDKTIVTFTRATGTPLGILRSGSVDNTKIEACRTGKILLGSSESGVLSTTNWITLEIIYKPSTTNGIFKVRVNGHLLIDLSGIKTSDYNDPVGRVCFGRISGYSDLAHHGYYDEIKIGRSGMGWATATSTSTTTTSSSYSTTSTAEYIPTTSSSTTSSTISTSSTSSTHSTTSTTTTSSSSTTTTTTEA